MRAGDFGCSSWKELEEKFAKDGSLPDPASTDNAEFASSNVALVPDVWAPARPAPDDAAPTPMYLPSPPDGDEHQSDLVIDTMPGNVPYPRDPGFDRPDGHGDDQVLGQ